MTEMCEGIAIYTPPKEEKAPEEKEKISIKLRIALFFDGTLNNRTNIDANEGPDKHKYDVFKDRGSFENGRTNIAIMESHMEKGIPPGYQAYQHFYIPGHGTFDLEKDYKKGYALAIGDSGVPARAKLGVDKAYSAVLGLSKNIFNPERQFLEKITIDVFGFSRGAATARYAIYLLLKDKKALYKRLLGQNYDVDENTVEVGFAGLYDTVLSYMASQMFKSARNLLQQTAHQYAKKVLHLTAAEEHRKDFPLHNIKCAKDGEEYYLPGSHSDVGGSYNKANEVEIEKENDPLKKAKLMMLTNDEDLTLNQGELWEMQADKKWLIEQGWYKGKNDNRNIADIKTDSKSVIKDLEQKGHFKIELKDGDFTTTLFFHPKQSNSYTVKVYFAYATLSVKRTGIFSGYSNIPLKIMADYVKKEPKLLIDSELEKRADAVIDICSLKDLQGEILSYIAEKKPNKSKKEDWLEGKRNIDLKPIRYQQLNFSASRGMGYNPNIVDQKRKRFIYDA